MVNLNLSNTKLTETIGLQLFESIIMYSKIVELNMSKNPGLGFKFSSHVLYLIKDCKDYKLEKLNLSYCGIS